MKYYHIILTSLALNSCSCLNLLKCLNLMNTYFDLIIEIKLNETSTCLILTNKALANAMRHVEG